MAAKKPLLPPGSRWNTLERPLERKKVEDGQPQNNGSELTPKLITSVSTDELKLVSLRDNNSHRKPPRSNSDDFLSHDKVHSEKPLPPTPPLNKFRVDGTNVDSVKPSIGQRSPTVKPPPPPPYRERNTPQFSNKSPKPPIVPRKIHPKPDEVDSQDKRPKPPLPRKPRTVHVTGGPALVLLRKPNIVKPLDPSRLLQKTDVHRPLHSPSKDSRSKVKIPVNEVNESKPSLEKMSFSKSMDMSTGVAVRDIECNDRPVSMILTSQVLPLIC